MICMRPTEINGKTYHIHFDAIKSGVDIFVSTRTIDGVDDIYLHTGCDDKTNSAKAWVAYADKWVSENHAAIVAAVRAVKES